MTSTPALKALNGPTTPTSPAAQRPAWMDLPPDALVQVAFILSGVAVPLNYQWHLFRALQPLMPWLHGQQGGALLGPISNLFTSTLLASSVRDLLALSPYPSAPSRLMLRLPVRMVHAASFLQGVTLDLEGCPVEVGRMEVRQQPSVEELSRAAQEHTLHSAQVVKGTKQRERRRGRVETPDEARERLHRRLLEIAPGEIGLRVTVGARSRIVIRDGNWRPAFAVEVGGASPALAHHLLTQGLGCNLHSCGGWFEVGPLPPHLAFRRSVYGEQVGVHPYLDLHAGQRNRNLTP